MKGALLWGYLEDVREAHPVYSLCSPCMCVAGLVITKTAAN